MLNELMPRLQKLNSLWDQKKQQPQQTQQTTNQPSVQQNAYMQPSLNQTEQPSMGGQNTYSQYAELFPMADSTTNPYGQYSSLREKMQASSPDLSQMSSEMGMGQESIEGSGSGVSAIAAGQKYIGNSKYVWGGGRKQSDIENGRFDCSGFVNYAFRQAGIDLGNGNTDTIAGRGAAVNPSQLQPGDIVFFDTYKKNGHVGIYMGNGKFIGSQSDKGVAVEDMTSGYWREKFNGNVRRV